MSRKIAKLNPKSQDIVVSPNGVFYGNDAFALNFQEGLVPRHGVRNGVFEEEVLAVLIDRAALSGNQPLVDALQAAMAILDPTPYVAPAAHAATDEPGEGDGSQE